VSATLKLWLDDERPVPDDSWTPIRSADEFSTVFQRFPHDIAEISFDHDIASYNRLTGEEITGYHCLCMVEKFWRYNADFKLPRMAVHSANAAGRRRMQLVINRLTELEAKAAK
jgi:hypothetical protein